MASERLPFDLPFTDASKYFARKIPLTREEFDVLSAWAKQRAFTVATIAKAELLQDVMDAAKVAVDEGITLADFNASLGEIMEETGWSGLTPWHAENVFRTNVQQAYGSGQLEQAREQADDFPWWLFVAILDDRTTEECESLNGTIFSIDDVTWWPPIHFECRSGTEPLTQAEAEELGIDPNPDLPDPTGFDGPGSDAGDEWDPDLSNLDDALGAAVRDELASFNPDDAVD